MGRRDAMKKGTRLIILVALVISALSTTVCIVSAEPIVSDRIQVLRNPVPRIGETLASAEEIFPEAKGPVPADFILSEGSGPEKVQFAIRDPELSGNPLFETPNFL